MNRAFDHSKYQNWIDPNEVIPYERNAKIHDDKQVANIANSIHRFGWQQDTVLTSDNVLVIGHGRRLAALKLGCKMPYHRIDKKADEVTDEDIRELRLAGNLTNSETGDDFTIKALEELDLDFEGFDFNFEELQEEQEKKQETEKRVEELQLKQFDHHDYIVFVFENVMDWMQVLSIFDIKKVDAGYGKTKKIGIGRVINGKILLEKIRYQNSDTEPRPQ